VNFELRRYERLRNVYHFLNFCFSFLGIDDQELPCLTPSTHNIDDNVESVKEKPTQTKKSLKRLKLVKF
jgi:hypothetical protein